MLNGRFNEGFLEELIGVVILNGRVVRSSKLVGVN